MKNNLFIAPASYFIENLEGQEKEKFKNGIFQYDNMICGMVEKTDFVNDRLLVSFKAPDDKYAEPVVSLSIDRYGADLSKFHIVKSVQRIDFYHFLKIKEQDIIDIIKKIKIMIKKEDIKVGSYLQIRKFDLEAIAGPKFVEDINKHCSLNTCVVKVVNMADGMCEIKYSFWCIPAVVNTEGLAKVAISSSAKKTANRKTEQVSHPSHYAWLKDLCGVEPLDICRHLDFNTGNAIKYLLRKDKVDGNKTKTEKRIEDLRKAAFYIQDEIKLLERGTD